MSNLVYKHSAAIAHVTRKDEWTESQDEGVCGIVGVGLYKSSEDSNQGAEA